VLAGLMVVEPSAGATVTDRFVVIRGLAPAGATITRDVPGWFDEHTVADHDGRWSFAEALHDGENDFTFRIGDDRTTEVHLAVYYSQEQ
jgi:hypothetical protein